MANEYPETDLPTADPADVLPADHAEETAGPSDDPASSKNASNEKHRGTAAHHPSPKRRRKRRRRENRALSVVNLVLLLLVGLGLAFCAVTGYQYFSFSAESYDAQISSLKEETVRIQADMASLQAELAQKDEQMRSDLHQAGEEGAAAADALNAVKTENETLKAENAALLERKEFVSNIYENTLALRQEYAGKIRQLEDRIVAGQSDVKICYWSFDDGPGTMTSAILDFCEENGLYVTFFTSREANETGRDDADEPALLRRETMLGNSVQNHTNSHQYSKIAGNLYTKGLDSFIEQVRLQDEWILQNTGFKADIFRFPGGAAWAYNLLPKDELLGALEQLGYRHIDWHCDVMDNLHSNPDASTVATRATWQSKQIDPPIVVMLSHDWNYNTYYGFMSAVKTMRERGFIFLPLFSQSWAMDNTTIRFS